MISKRVILVSVSILILLLSTFTQAAVYGGGDGSADDPYQIWTPQQMNDIGANPNDWGKCFKLMADIDMAGLPYNMIGDVNMVIPFSGTFTGNGHVIKNVTIITDYFCAGMFNYISGATIKNLGVENLYLSSSIEYTGGLVGFNEVGLITSCYVTGSVHGTSFVGGLAAFNLGTITSCYSAVSVNGTEIIGGFAAENYDTIVNCYSIGQVSATNYAGGLTASNGGWITNSFWDIETSGQTSSDGGTGITTAEMMTLSTFTSAGWDFNGTEIEPAIWIMLRAGEDYPRLMWQECFAGDIAGLYGVNMADLMEVVNYWLQQGCPTGCEQADIDNSGTVDLGDLSILAVDWLRE